jgi:hypothetical protein
MCNLDWPTASGLASGDFCTQSRTRLYQLRAYARLVSSDFMGETWAPLQLKKSNALISMVGAVGIEPTTSSL